MRRIFTAMLVVVVAASCFTGCQNPFDELPDDTYFVDYGSDSLNYKLYINKQTTIILNHLSSHMTLTLKATDENKNDLIVSARQSLSEMNAAKEFVEKIYPPSEYTDSHQHIIALYEKAIGNIEALIAALEKETLDQSELSDLAALMQTNFLALTNEFNQYII